MVSGRVGRRLAGFMLLSLLMTSPNATAETRIEDFEQIVGWTTSASEGANVTITQDVGHSGMAMRVDFDMPRDGGWVIVRKEVDLTLPGNYAFTFQLRGKAPRNNAGFN